MSNNDLRMIIGGRVVGPRISGSAQRSRSQQSKRTRVVHENEAGHHRGARHRSKAPTVDTLFGVVAAHYESVISGRGDASPTGILAAADGRRRPRRQP